MKIKSQIKKNRIDEDLSKSTVIDSKKLRTVTITNGPK